MDQNVYNGYRTNCIKRKKKVLGLIELYNKDSVTCTTHKDIYKEELDKIDKATGDFMDYIDDVLTQLEANSEVDRLPELETIKRNVIDAVKVNKTQVIEKVGSLCSTTPSTEPSNTIGGAGDIVTPDSLQRLTLKYNNIVEDIEEFKVAIKKVGIVNDMSDSEVTYYMRRVDSWDTRLKEITNQIRKFQEEALGKDDAKTMVDEVTLLIKDVKLDKSAKVTELTDEDSDRGLNSLCENKHKSSVIFPEPFKGVLGENVFKFEKEITAAIKNTQVKKADQVRTLLKYLKGEAKARVGDHQTSLEAALNVLKDFYGNPNLIWIRYKQEFEKEFGGSIGNRWGALGSTKRVDAIAKMLEFIRQAIQFSQEYPQLKEDILSAHTVKLLMKSMPHEEVRMIYLSIDEVNASHLEKIEKIQEILVKLKNCGILAVNELVDDTVNSKGGSIQRSKEEKGSLVQHRNPLGINIHDGSVCSVDIRHDCTKCKRCEPNFGLLGCEELYKLNTAEERIQYCKEAGCCISCGISLPNNVKETSCKRCDYFTPTNRKIVRCSVTWFSAAANKIQRCFRGAALCLQHQSQRNADSKLLDWLKERRIKHEMFMLNNKIQRNLSKKEHRGHTKNVMELPDDKKVLDMLKKEMEVSDFEHGEIEPIPDGENMFMFFLIQGKPGTEPIQVFADSGANFWFALESVTKKLVCIRTNKDPMPITIGGGNVIYSTGEWAAALPMANGCYQAVRGQTMKSLVGQMPRYDLTRTLNEVKEQYPNNKRLQKLVIPPVLGGEVEMILGSKYLRIYPEPIQVTPTGLTISISRLRSPTGQNTAVISGPVKFINSVLHSKNARDAFESMKAMLVHARSYKPTLEFFPSCNLSTDPFPCEVQEAHELGLINYEKEITTTLVDKVTCSSCRINVTVQSELKRYMEMQEAGLKTEFRCSKCRGCGECRKGAGFERLSMKQEAEQELVRDSIELKDGYAIAKLPFTLTPEDNLKSNRNIALKRLDNIIKKYCADPIMKEGLAKAWEKMISKGHLVFLKDMSSDLQRMLHEAKTSYYIPWNLNFKESLSTPIRTTFDASSQTGSGLSLNDCLAKGTPNLVQLLALVLDWMMGPHAFCGDISQFYPSIHLIPEHWQYQRILLRENLNLDGQILEAVLVKLAFGVQSVSAQSEEAVRRVAMDIRSKFPKVASLLIHRRYVDDVGKSTMSKEESMDLINKSSEVLKNRLNMGIKGWSVSGERPPGDVSSDGQSVGFGGFVWFPEIDAYSLNIPPLCLDKKLRGRLPDGSFGFDPQSMKIEDYVPINLTRRQITRAVAKTWDPTGKLAPLSLRIKHDLRKLIKESPEWDKAISSNARSLWLQNFNMMEQVRGLLYSRCTRPSDAVRKKCRLWLVVDAAEWGMIVTAYAGWEKSSGGFSCSHLLGKGLLGPEQLTLPQKELHVLSVGADIKDFFTSALDEWVEEVLVASDSEIALCWASYETVKLNQFNRVRVINITSKVNLEDLYHVNGQDNPADIGTRVKNISASDVFPDSEYICGKEWLKLTKEEAVEKGFVKPVQDIKLSHDQKKVVKRGIVYDSFERDDDSALGILLAARVDVRKVAEREIEAKYPYSPLQGNFLKFVDVIALLLKFRNKIKKNQHTEAGHKFSILSYYSPKVVKHPPVNVISEVERNSALKFIYQRETMIVKKFNSSRMLSKISLEEDEILFCKTRILEEQTVKVVGGLRMNDNLSELFNLNFKVPLIDEHSPLAYPLALHLHNLFNHRGYETCYRLSLNFVKILGGMRIFKSINSNCIICMKERKRFMRVSMGSINECQVTVSPIFYFVQVDLWGPLRCYCPGYERLTRRDKAYDVYMLVFSCLATSAVNVQVIEGKSAEFVLDGCNRFFSEASVPKIMFPDDDGALVLAFTRGEINLEDLSGTLYKTKGIIFEKCAPQAHSGHGKVERVIRSLQESFTRSGASSSRLTATGWSTIAKKIERDVNDTPIGFLFDKTTAHGNPLLRILKPSSLKGMNASDRAPRGLFLVPDLPQKHFNKVQECYDLWYGCWSTSYLPLILKQQKWYDDDDSLAPNDIVHFKIKDSPMKADWRTGKVESVKFGRDNRVREVNVGYKILKDGVDEWSHSVVTRPVREIVKLYEVGDTTFAEDMLSVQKMAKQILIERGALKEDTIGSSDVSALNLHEELQHKETVQVFEKHLPFLNCSDAGSWYGAELEMKETCYQSVFGDREIDIKTDIYDETLFLI